MIPALLLAANVLMVVVDDAGAMNHWPVDRMPAVARLIAEGTSFTEMYGATSCTASRTKFLLGREAVSAGPGMNLYGTLPASLPSYPDLLAAAGISIGWNGGKCWGPGSPLAGGRTTDPCGPKMPDLLHAIGSVQGNRFAFIYGLSAHRGWSQHDFTLPPAELPSWFPIVPTVTKDAQDYVKAMVNVDVKLAGMIAVLEQKGILDQTLVCFVADNGWPFPGGKADTRLEGSRIGAVCRLPGTFTAGDERSDFTTIQDLGVTALAAMGVSPASGMTGVDLAASPTGRAGAFLARERHCDGRFGMLGYPSRGWYDGRYHLIHNFYPARTPMGDSVIPAGANCGGAYSDTDNGPTKTEILRKSHGVYVNPAAQQIAYGQRPEWELFDNLTDPEELTNVYWDNTALVATLEAQLIAEMAANGDPALTNPDTFDAYPWYN